MLDFVAGEEVMVKGTVLRTRDGRVELQLGDKQLIRVPFAHVAKAPAVKAVEEPPEHKAVTHAPANKSARSRNSGDGK